MGDECRIWVGGLPGGIEKDEIREEYKRFGEIESITIYGKSGTNSFAFVQYTSREDAEEAVRGTDQAKLFGMPFVKVSWSGKASKGKGKGRRSRSRQGSPRRRSRSARRQRSSSRQRNSSPPPKRDSPARSPPPQPRDTDRNRSGQDRIRDGGSRDQPARRSQASRSPPRRLPPPPLADGDDKRNRRQDSRPPQRAPPRSDMGRDRMPGRDQSYQDDRRQQPAQRRQASREPYRAPPPPGDRSQGRDRPYPDGRRAESYSQRPSSNTDNDRARSRNGYADDRRGERAPPRHSSRSREPPWAKKLHPTERSERAADTRSSDRQTGGPPSGAMGYVKPSEQKGQYRVKIENLPEDIGWQELKNLGTDFAKQGKCTFSRTNRDHTGVLEFTSFDDMNYAIQELDGRRFSGDANRLVAYEERERRR